MIMYRLVEHKVLQKSECFYFPMTGDSGDGSTMSGVQNRDVIFTMLYY